MVVSGIFGTSTGGFVTVTGEVDAPVVVVTTENAAAETLYRRYGIVTGVVLR